MKAEFGNLEQIALIKKERAEQEFIKNSKECIYCDGKKTIRHECDCTFCNETEEECEICDGLGRINN